MSRHAAGCAAQREHGAAAVEMAIIFPLMFLVLAGIVDLGRAFFFQIQLTNAAREGARVAVVADPADDPANTLVQIQTRAASSAPAVPALVTNNPLPQLCGGGATEASVTASTSMDWYLLKPAMNIILVGNFPEDFNMLSSTAVMQCGG